MTGWTIGNVVREAYANATAATARLVVLAAAFGGLSFSVFWLELSALGDVEALDRSYVAAGGYVAVVSSDVGLDAATCHRLSSHPTLTASGGYRTETTVNLTVSPRVAFQHLAATVGLLRVWDPAYDHSPDGYVVGRAAAEELGLRGGSWVAGPSLPAATVTVFDPELRNRFASRALLELMPPTGTVDECWVQLSRATFESGMEMLAAVFAEDEGAVRRAIARGDFAQTPQSLLSSRISQWGWLPASGVAAAVLALMSLFRRPEVAVYRAFGLPPAGVLLMLQVETVLVAIPSVSAGACWAAAAYAASAGDVSLSQQLTAARTELLLGLTIVALAPITASVAAAGTPAALLKER